MIDGQTDGWIGGWMDGVEETYCRKDVGLEEKELGSSSLMPTDTAPRPLTPYCAV